MSSAAIVDVTAALERQDRKRHVYPLLAWCVFIMILDGFAVAILPAAAPYMMAEWGIDRTQFGIVFGIAQVGILIGAGLLGFLADRFGRRPVIIGGVLIFGLLSLVVPLVADVSQLSVVRFIAACTLGGVKPVLYAFAVEAAPKSMRSWVIAVVYAGVSIGQVLAGLLAGLIITDHGWRAIFVIGAAAPVLAAALLYVYFPESIRFLSSRPGRRADLVRQLRRCDPSRTYDADSRYELRDEGAGAPDTRPFTPRQLFEGRLFRITSLVWICEICSSFVTFYFYTWTPVLARGLGAAPETASYCLAALATGAVAGPLLLSWLISRWGGQWMLVASIAGTLYLAALGLVPLGGGALLPAFLVVGLFCVGIQLTIAAMFMQFYPTRIRANAVGWMILIGGLGSVGSPVLFGRIMESGVAAPTMFLLSAIPMALLLWPTWLLVSDYRRLNAEDAA